MLCCSGAYGLWQTLIGAVMENIPAKREQGAEEIKETAQNDPGF